MNLNEAEHSCMQVLKGVNQSPYIFSPVKKVYLCRAGYKKNLNAHPVVNALSNFPTLILEPIPVTPLFMTTGIVYSCPMHPEVQQSHPGSCPKCGMTLEPEMPTLEEE